MIFREFLQEIVNQAEGAIATTLMGEDGIPIADLTVNEKCPIDIKTVAIEFGKLLKETNQIMTSMAGGALEELVVSSKDFSMLFLPVNEQYFVALLISRGGNFGKGRYLLKKYRPKILEQL